MNSAHGKIMFEMASASLGTTQLTDDGDHKTFKHASAYFISNRKDYAASVDGVSYAPTVIDNGVISGGKVVPGASNDTVSAPAATCNLNGVADKAVSANTSLSITRGGVGVPYMKNSIIINSSGVYAVVTGTGHASAFSEVRGDAGGPPYIPVDAIEVGQTWTTSDTAAVLTSDEVKWAPGLYTEMVNNPQYEIKYSRESYGVLSYAGVDFLAALPAIHTGDTAKAVWMTAYEPEFAEIPGLRNLTPPANTISSTSEQFYNSTIADTSMTLSDGSFEFAPKNGVTDPFLIVPKQSHLWVKFWPDRASSEYIAMQGGISLAPAYPAEGVTTWSGVISSQHEFMRVNG